MNPQINLCRHLQNAAISFPDDLAVAVQKATFNRLSYQELSFQALHQESDKVAYALSQFGLKKGQKTVLMVKPSLDFFIVTFALFKAGIIPILVDPGMGTKNLKQCFIEAQPDAFIGIGKAQLARKLLGWGKASIKFNITVEKNGLLGGTTLSSIIKQYPLNDHYEMQQLDEHEMAAILFTSGSTGSPKGVVYSHRIFEAQIALLKDEYQIKHGERDLATFPLFSLFGPALGMASIVPEMDASKPITANPDYLFAAIKKYQCTNLFANPALVERLGIAGMTQGIKLKSIQRVISAGAPATISSINRFVKLLTQQTELLNSYGATESLPISKIPSSELIKTEEITRTGGGICVGKAVKNTQIKIIKITDDALETFDQCHVLENYEIGEIIVKGPQVTKQYYNRDEATVESKIQDGNSFYHRMGDLGYLDEFDRLWMCGRKKHRVETKSKTYYSIPVERIFNTHTSVKRSALVGVEKNGTLIPVVCIELSENADMTPLRLFNELHFLAKDTQQAQQIKHFLIHQGFPMDIRHNAKIFREKLAVWATDELLIQ